MTKEELTGYQEQQLNLLDALREDLLKKLEDCDVAIVITQEIIKVLSE